MTKYRSVLCVGLWVAALSVLLATVFHSRPVRTREVPAANPSEINYDALVRAITQVESQGNPRAVGRAGERGLMQIKESTWAEVTRRKFGREVPFDRAFEPDLNRQVGRAYLEQIAARLEKKRDRLNDSLPALVVASYHRGPSRIEKLGFATKGLSPAACEYVERVLALHARYSLETRTLAMETRSGR